MAYLRGGPDPRHTPDPELMARLAGVRATPGWYTIQIEPGRFMHVRALDQDVWKRVQAARQASAAAGGGQGHHQGEPLGHGGDLGVTDMMMDTDGVFIPEDGK